MWNLWKEESRDCGLPLSRRKRSEELVKESGIVKYLIMTSIEKGKEDYVASGIIKYPFMDKLNMQKWNFPVLDCPLLSARLVARGSVDHSHIIPV